MKPTIEQLDLWSAEALGWANTVNGMLLLASGDWHPCTDLGQAWRSFVSVLNDLEISKKGRFFYKLNQNSDVICELQPENNWTVIAGKGETDDQRAAYALTYAFVLTMNPVGYKEWKANEVSGERSE